MRCAVGHWAITDLRHYLTREEVAGRGAAASIVLWHREDASQGQLSHLGEFAGLRVKKSWKKDG